MGMCSLGGMCAGDMEIFFSNLLYLLSTLQDGSREPGYQR